MSTASRLALELVIQARDTASAALARLRAGMEGISSLGSRFGQGLAGAFSGIEAKIFAVTSAIGALGVSLGLGSAVEAASKFEQLKLQLTGLDGSAKAADAAIAAIQKSFKPAQVQSVTEAYVQLRTFGLQPSVEDLRSLIDFNARTGKGMENLQGIIAQVGQAWSKEKLQYEDVLVLLERGVPVWNLLTQATGKSTIELQAMASKGELTREYIAKLVAEMGKASEGASDLASSGWQGLKDQFSSLVDLFQRSLVEGGIFQTLKTKLGEVNDVLTYAVNSGLARQWGEQLGASLTNAGTYVVGFMRSLSGAFGALQIFFNAFSAGIAAMVGAVAIGIAKLVDSLAALADWSGAETLKADLEAMADGFRGASDRAVDQVLKDKEDMVAGWTAMESAFSNTSSSIVTGYQSLVEEAKKAKESVSEPLNVQSLKAANDEVDRLRAAMIAGATAAKVLQNAEDELTIAVKAESLARQDGNEDLSMWSRRVAELRPQVEALRATVTAGRSAADGLADAQSRAAAAGNKLGDSAATGAKASASLTKEWVASAKALQQAQDDFSAGAITSDALAAAQQRAAEAARALQSAMASVGSGAQNMGGLLQQSTQSSGGSGGSGGLSSSTEWAKEYTDKLHAASSAQKEVSQSAGEMSDAQKENKESTEQSTQALTDHGDMARWMRQAIDESVGSLREHSEAAANAADAVINTLSNWYDKTEQLQLLAQNTKLFDTSGATEAAREVAALTVELERARVEVENWKWDVEDSLNSAWDMSVFSNGIAAIKQMEVNAIQAQIATARLDERSAQLSETMEDLAQRYANGEINMAEYTRQLEFLSGTYRTLGDERLEGLRDALADAKEKTDALRASAQSALQTALEAAGSASNAREIEELKWAQLQQDLQDQLNEARQAGDAQAIADLERAMNLQLQAHNETMRQIAAEEAARKQAATGGGSVVTTDPNDDGVIVSSTLPTSNEGGTPSSGGGTSSRMSATLASADVETLANSLGNTVTSAMNTLAKSLKEQTITVSVDGRALSDVVSQYQLKAQQRSA